MNDKELLDLFPTLPRKDMLVDKANHITMWAKNMVLVINEYCKDSPEKTESIQKLKESVELAIKAIPEN